MNISYYGLSCFKVTSKPAGRGSDDVNAFFAPFDKNTGLRPPASNADVVFVSHDSDAYNNAAALRGEPLVLHMPGEYAVKGISAVGVAAPADAVEGAQNGLTTIFTMQSEDIAVCHLGAIGGDLSATDYEKIGDVDILMVPVGGGAALSAKAAEEICRKIEPKMIIPMQYNIKGVKSSVGKLDDVKAFLAAFGADKTASVDKLLVKKADLDGKSMEVVLLDVV